MCTKSASQTLTQAYLACGLPRPAANASFFVIQSQPTDTGGPGNDLAPQALKDGS